MPDPDPNALPPLAAPETAEAPERAQRPAEALLFLVFTVVLVVGIFAAGLIAELDGPDFTMLSLAVVTIVLGLIPLGFDRLRPPRHRHLVLSIFLLAFMGYWVSSVFFLYIPAFGPTDAAGLAFSNLLPQHVIRGQLAGLLAMSVVLLTYVSPVGRLVGRAVPRFQREWSLADIILVSAIMLPLGWAIALASMAGLVPSELGSGVISTLASSYIYVNVLMTYAYLKYRSRGALIVLAFNVPANMLIGTLTGSKEAMLIGPGVVVVTWMVLKARLPLRLIAIGAFALFGVYPISEFVKEGLLPQGVGALARNPGAALSQVQEFVGSNKPEALLLDGFERAKRRFDGVGVTSVIIRETPREVPFQYGKTLYILLLFPVPRLIWPGKPVMDIGGWITEVYGSGPGIRSSTGPTQVGDFYLNFGWPGIIGGMFLIGLLIRILHETCGRRPLVAPGVLVMVVSLQQIGFGFMANVASSYGTLLFAVAPVILMHIALGALRGSRRALADDLDWQGAESGVSRHV